MRIGSLATATALAGISALHIGWGRGSSFPSSDRETLADTVAGTTVVPGPSECFAVAGSLLSAAALIMDVVPLNRRVRGMGVAGAALVLGTRGVLGVTGRTGTIVPWTPSERFTELDRRYYGPLCLALSAGAFSSLKS